MQVNSPRGVEGEVHPEEGGPEGEHRDFPFANERENRERKSLMTGIIASSTPGANFAEIEVQVLKKSVNHYLRVIPISIHNPQSRP